MRLTMVLRLLCLLVILAACDSDRSISPEEPEPTLVRTQSSATPTSIPPTPTTVIDRARPITLVIPAIELRATVEPVGIRTDGDLATPNQNPWENVGWYNGGPHPGERGSAVIDGHLDRPGGLPAVFWRLSALRVGDEVLVTMVVGKTLHFRVTRIAFYPPQSAPLQEIFGNRGGVYLNLITCAGDWIASQHQTTLRQVVYTALTHY